MFKILVNSILVFQSLLSFSRTYWKIEDEYGDEILLTINLNNEKKTFEAYTRKDALKDIAGSLMFTLAKTAGKLKYPEIVFIEGKTQTKKDSLMLTGTFYYFDKQFAFSAAISGNSFKGKYIDRNRPRLLSGVKMPNDKPIKNYPSIINTAFSITEKNLLNPVWIKSDEWTDFREKVNELNPKIADDYELAATFVWLGKKLPFSPYEINKLNPASKPNSNKKVALVKELKPNTALLESNSLPETQREMDSIATVIDKKRYANLIIDLRGRSRINPGNSNILLNYLTNKSFYAGVYLTRKWFDNNSSIPKPADYKKLFKGFADSDFKSGTFSKEPGRYLNVVPNRKTFKGKVYVLTDAKTSKVAEVLAYLLKNEKLALVVGQKTSGSTMIDEPLKINNEFELNLPYSDFYTAEGKSLNQKSIEPDIPVSGEDALKYILMTL